MNSSFFESAELCLLLARRRRRCRRDDSAWLRLSSLGGSDSFPGWLPSSPCGAGAVGVGSSFMASFGSKRWRLDQGKAKRLQAS